MSGCTLKAGGSLGHTRRQCLISAADVSFTATLFGIMLLVMSLLCMAPVMAAYLSVPESVSLAAGEHWLQPLPPVDSQGQRIQIALGEAPPGVLLTVNDAGQMILHWQTGPDLAAESYIDILLSSIDTGKLLERQQIVIYRLEPDRVVPTPVKTGRTTAAASYRAPQLAELANQLVSPGYVVRLQVNATSTDASTPIVQIDRLPRRASFDVSKGGSHIFYWHTDNQDEGEHVFRFTAINPVDVSLRTSREVMIVVGDPDRNRTQPEVEDTSIQR